MRVIAGKNKGKKLEALPGLATRPTADRVKEALFNMIQDRIPGAKVLDLFAGSGALGIEALSRGAKHVTFVDNNREAIDVIKRNVTATQNDPDSRVVYSDWIIFLQNAESYDIIFLDPPYQLGYLDETVSMIIAKEAMALGGVIVCECSKDEDFEPSGFKKLKDSRYGKTKILIFERQQAGDGEGKIPMIKIAENFDVPIEDAGTEEDSGEVRMHEEYSRVPREL